MKICHITSAHNNNDVRILKKECVSLAKKREDEVFLVGRGDSYIENGVNVIGIENMSSSRIARMLTFSKTVVRKALEIEADVYHFHDPELLRYAKQLKKTGAKVIFDSHENVLESIDGKTYMPVFLRKLAKAYFSYIEKKVYPLLDGIVVVTPQMVNHYQKYNSNVEVIGNYPIIDNDFLYEKCSDDSFIFAGGISAQWSHKEIIEAIDGINNVEYRLFGLGSGEYFEQLKQLHGWGNVQYGGRISFEDVQKEIRHSKFSFALLKPGKNTFGKEGTLGNTKLFETMAYGKPIIATDFTLWRDIVAKHNCGLCVDPNDVNEIRKAIKKMISLTEEEYKQMSQNCREVVEKYYSWDVCEKSLYSFYDRVINKEER